MNKKSLITELIIFAVSLILLCVVQLIKITNPLLLTNSTVLIIFAVSAIISGAVTTVSLKSDTDEMSVGNLALPILLGCALYAMYSIPSLGFSEFFGLGNSVCISFLGIFSSRYAFSFSEYARVNNFTGKYKVSKNIEVSLFQKNINSELYEILNIIGYLALIVSTIALVYNTFNPCFNIAL